MPIVKTFDFYDFIEEFRTCNRMDNFSRQGLEFIFDYLSDCYYDTNWEMDCIAICSEFVELTASHILVDFNIDRSEYLPDELNEVAAECLNDNTTIIGEYLNNEGETVFIFVAF